MIYKNNHRRLKLLPIVMIVFMMIFTMCLPVLANSGGAPDKLYYTAIGDSIPFGGSGSPEDAQMWVENSYPDLLAQFYDPYFRVKYRNMSVPGIDSTMLLTELKNEASLAEGNMGINIRKADLVTVCIGGNNLLGPLQENLNHSSDPTQWDLSLFENGVVRFAQEWPLILQEIRKNNPTAKVVAMTIYNPIPLNTAFPVTAPENALYRLAETYLYGINHWIKNPDLMGTFGYKVADVYTEFATGAYAERLTYGPIDPHPTQAGHEVIFRLHRDILSEL